MKESTVVFERLSEGYFLMFAQFPAAYVVVTFIEIRGAAIDINMVASRDENASLGQYAISFFLRPVQASFVFFWRDFLLHTSLSRGFKCSLML